MNARHLLVQDTGDQTGGDGTATLADVEALTVVSSNMAVGLKDHLKVVAGHRSPGHVPVREAEVGGLI